MRYRQLPMRNTGAVAKGLHAIWEAKSRQAAVREFACLKAHWWTDEERAVRCLDCTQGLRGATTDWR